MVEGGAKLAGLAGSTEMVLLICNFTININTAVLFVVPDTDTI